MSPLFKTLAAVLCLMAHSTAQAISVLAQTAQGGYTSNVLGGTSWTTFTGMLTAQHTLTTTNDFSNQQQLDAYGAIWVDQEQGNTLSASEISSLQSYVAAGHKLVLIGENAYWNPWNTSIMSVVGGSHNGICSTLTGTPLVTNALTSGVSSVENECGSIALNNVGPVTVLFSNNMAALYSIGAGEALVILDSNWNDDIYIGTQDNHVFAANVVNWLGAPLDNAVPEPESLFLTGLALAGLGVSRRRNAAVAAS